MTAIVDIIGREILDSRGNPTVEVDVVLEDGSLGRAACRPAPPPARTRPSSCATATRSATSARACCKAVEAVNGEIFDALSGMDAEDQRRIDDALIEARRHAQQGPARRQCHPRRVAGGGQGGGGGAAALPLYRYLGGANAHLLPVPMMNIINGGAHADNPIDIQEFMIMPVGAADLRRRHPHGRRDLPHAAQGPQGRGPLHQRRRRGRLCAQPQVGGGGARLHHEVDRERPATSRARTWRWRSIARPPSSTRAASTRWKARASRSTPAAWRNTSPTSSRASPSSRSRTAWPRTTGRAGRR